MDNFQLKTMANLVETARTHLVENQDSIVKAARALRAAWLQETNEAAITEAVDYASRKLDVMDPGVRREVHASLKFRVLAGMIKIPVEVPDEIRGGICANQEYDEVQGGWPCKVDGNQAQADAWHTAFGNSPACPFWKPMQEVEPNPDQLQKLLQEGESLDEAWRQLGVVHGKADKDLP